MLIYSMPQPLPIGSPLVIQGNLTGMGIYETHLSIKGIL